MGIGVLGARSIRGGSGSGDPLALDGEVGVLDGLQVAGGAFDAEPEQVADTAKASSIPFWTDPVVAATVTGL